MSTFERLADDGREAILAGRQACEAPPVDGQPRWGTSAILRPDPATAEGLEAFTADALGVAGAAHWATGRAISSHLTLRSLEPYRSDIAAGDPTVAIYVRVLADVTREADPLRFALEGVLLTPVSIMVAARPLGPGADELARAFAAGIGDGGWYERGRRRDIWYVNVVHFAGPVRDPPRLVRWVDDRHDLDLGVLDGARPAICGWSYDGSGLVPVELGA